MTATAPGLEGVTIGTTRLSRVDGEAGELLVAGFPLAELAHRARFEETLFLLWNDRLPRPAERDALRAELAAHRELPPATLELLRAAAAAGAAPMAALRMAVGTLGLADGDLHRTGLHAETAAANRRRALRLVAAFPTVVAAYHRIGQGREPVAPDPALGHAASYLHLLSGETPDPARVRALETYLNAAVDHGMNASTFAARVVASTRSDLVSAITAALGALLGPLHGGAPGPALDMVLELARRARDSGEPLAATAERWARERVAAGERIMGFGHRVYRVRDPRADVLGAAAARLFPESPTAESRVYAQAREVEAVVLRVLADTKPGRRLETNVEFYTALLLHGLGFPPALFTPTFAVSRVGGWTAHVLEQVAADRLIRPRVRYAGATGRTWPGPEERDAA